MNRFEWVRLHVLRQESDVADALCPGVLAPEFQKSVTAINSQNRSGRAHQACQLDRGIAKASTRINNLIALLHRKAGEDHLTMQG